MSAPLYDQTVTFTNGGGLGLGLGFGLGVSSSAGGAVESQTTRIGGEKKRAESLRVERATGLGGDFIDVEDDFEDEEEDFRLRLRDEDDIE